MRYAIESGDITEKVYRKEMETPIEDMKRFLDGLYRLYGQGRDKAKMPVKRLGWRDMIKRTSYVAVPIAADRKRKRVRTAGFCDTLAAIFKAAKRERSKRRLRYGAFYSFNYYAEVKGNDRIYYEVYTRHGAEDLTDKPGFLGGGCYERYDRGTGSVSV